MSHILITGVKPSAGTWNASNAPARQEINTLIKDNVSFSLYIQALQKLYATPQSTYTSHFGMGGIHGLPPVPWDGAGGNSSSSQQWNGYCQHGTMLFPTWHRPYVALYEQSLQAKAVEVASTYTVNKAQYEAAAQKLRAPYWDWAANANPPSQLTSQKVTITGPNGKSESVTNPLYGYPFNPVDPSFGQPYTNWKTTVRWPTRNGTSDMNEMISNMKAEGPQLKSAVYSLLTRTHTWPAFSNHSPDDGGDASSSLEGIHDNVHGSVGGSGHMGDPAVAAFDPIFFLHHCNVDRLFALWQAMNPGVWVSNGPAESGTWTLKPGASVNNETGLSPFWQTQNDYWPSSDCKDWYNKFGYTYPEFVGVDMSNQNAVKTAISAKISALYGTGSGRVRASRAMVLEQAGPAQAVLAPAVEAVKSGVAAVAEAVAPAPETKPAPVPETKPAPMIETKPAPIPTPPEKDLAWHDWVVKIQSKKFVLKGSYSVHIFLGEVPAEPSQWIKAESYVGSHRIFANSAMEQCENCTELKNMKTEGIVHLNHALARLLKLEEDHDFAPEAVLPYVKEKLHWRVMKPDYTEVKITDELELSCTVASVPLVHKAGHHLPTHEREKVKHHHHVTEGRLGGARRPEEY